MLNNAATKSIWFYLDKTQYLTASSRSFASWWISSDIICHLFYLTHPDLPPMHLLHSQTFQLTVRSFLFLCWQDKGKTSRSEQFLKIKVVYIIFLYKGTKICINLYNQRWKFEISKQCESHCWKTKKKDSLGKSRKASRIGDDAYRKLNFHIVTINYLFLCAREEIPEPGKGKRSRMLSAYKRWRKKETPPRENGKLQHGKRSSVFPRTAQGEVSTK